MSKYELDKELYLKVINSQTEHSVINDSSHLFAICFTNNDSIPKSSIINIDFDSVIEVTNHYVVFTKYSSIYEMIIRDGILEMDDESNITIRYNSNTNLYVDIYQNQIQPLAFYNEADIVNENSYMPEFSIASFDDSGFIYPRLVRQGVPIISTVPASVDSNSLSSDLQYYNNGKGPKQKTIYFRIVCNKVMESISIGEVSEMQLKIYVPNGLDTVKPAVYRDMILVSNDLSNNISIYSSNYDFYEQGNYQGLEYVDGYMYCDVQVPLTVQKSMPLEFDFML